MTASQNQNQKRKPIPGVLDLLNLTFSLYRRDFSLLFGYAAWLLIPVLAAFLASLLFEESVSQIFDIVFNYGFYILLVMWLSVVYILIVPNLLKGKARKSNKISKQAWRAFAPFTLLTLFVYAFTIVGLAALIAPGVLISTWFTFAGILLVRKRLKIFEAMKASRELVRNRFWAVFRRLLAGFLLILLFYLGAVGVGILIFGAFSPEGLPTYLESPPGLPEQLYSQTIEILILPAFMVYHILLYLGVTGKLVIRRV